MMVSDVGPIILLSVVAAVSLFAACKAAIPINFQEACNDAHPDFVKGRAEGFFPETFVNMLLSSFTFIALQLSPTSPTGQVKGNADAPKPAIKGFAKKTYRIEVKNGGPSEFLSFELRIACYKDPPKAEAGKVVPPKTDAAKADHQKADNSKVDQSKAEATNAKAKAETTKADSPKGYVMECKYGSIILDFEHTREIDLESKKFCAKCLRESQPEVTEMAKTEKKRCQILEPVQEGNGGIVEW